MDTTAIYQLLLMPFLAVIYVNVTSTASLCMSCIKMFSYIQCWWSIGCHMFPLQTSYQGAQPLFLSCPFLDLCFFSRSLVSISPASTFLSSWFVFISFSFSMSSSSIIFFYAIILDGDAFLVSFVLVLDDVVTWVIEPIWWVLIFICLFFDAFNYSQFSVMSALSSSSCIESISFIHYGFSPICLWLGHLGSTKNGYLLVIYGWLSLVYKLFTLYMPWLLMGSSIHMKEWSFFLVSRKKKKHLPHLFAGISDITPTVLYFLLLVFPMYTSVYAPKVILSLL